METTDNLKAVLDAGAASALPVASHGGIPYAVVPAGYGLHDLEFLLPAPARKHGEVYLAKADSFIHYVSRHGQAGSTLIYAHTEAEKGFLSLTAVLNDHSDTPDWRDHKCHFLPRLSVEWKRWQDKDREAMNQSDFAAYLEDNLPDIASAEGMPSGADILHMALGFEANADKRLRSKINLQNGGVQFEFVEDEDKDTRSRMQVFQRFLLGIPVFDGSEHAYPLEARLKYREKDGKVTFWYELIRPDRVFKAAVDDELARIQAGTGYPVLFGRP